MAARKSKPTREDQASRRGAPLEKVIVGRVMDEARRLGYLVYKMHGGPYSVRGIPDVLAIKDGVACWMEAKRPGEEPTKIQVARMRELREAGCRTAVVTSAGEARDFLEGRG